MEHVVSVHDGKVAADDVTAVEELPVSVSLVDDKEDRAFATEEGSRQRRDRHTRVAFHDRAA